MDTIRQKANRWDLDKDLISLALLVVEGIEILEKEEFCLDYFNEYRRKYRYLDKMLGK